MQVEERAVERRGVFGFYVYWLVDLLMAISDFARKKLGKYFSTKIPDFAKSHQCFSVVPSRTTPSKFADENKETFVIHSIVFYVDLKRDLILLSFYYF